MGPYFFPPTPPVPTSPPPTLPGHGPVVSQDGEFTVYRGYDYLAADGRAIWLRVDDPADLSDATVQVETLAGVALAEASVTPGEEAGSYLLSFDLPRSVTEDLVARSRVPLRLRVTQSGGSHLLGAVLTMRVR